MSFWSDPLGSIQGTFSDPSKEKGLGELALGALAVGTMNPELLGLGGAGATVAPATELTSAAGLSPTLASSGFNAAGTDAVSSGITGLNPATAQTAFNAAGTDAVSSGITELNPATAQTAFNAGADSAIANGAATPSFLNSLQTTWAGLPTSVKVGIGGIAGLAALMKMGAFKPNYMPTYQPPTAASYGLGSTLAAGYKPYRPMASGGITSLAMGGVPGDPYPQSHISNDIYHAPTQLPTTANQMVGYQTDNLPMAQSIDNSMASGGMTAAGESSGPLQTYQAPSTSGTSLQDLASQYGVQLPSSLSGTTMAAEGGIMGLADGGTGTYNLGGYSDGGRLLKGPGDGMSDNIPASIADKQPARLADGEFVVPADVVSHLGNGSTDAGAKHLYTMMDKVRKARTGHSRQGKQIDAQKYMPA